MNILDPAILHYLDSLTPPRDSTLQQMERIAAEKRFPIIGPLVGRLLFQLALLTRARRIFELGSGYGYSAIWFARGLQPGGRIICTDGSRENAALAARFFKQADIEGLVDYRTGDALSLLAKEPGSFDIILNDVDKHEYPEVFRQAVPRLKRGGLLITDNTLWQGRVVGDDNALSTVGVRAFNRLAFQSKEVLTTLIPLRDGVALSIKR
jgi:predicted O-methyltransferase YrrM